jgi:hypothetical protein
MNSEEELDLHYTNLYEVPSYVFEKKLLKKLYLSSNQLTKVSVSLGNLSLLQYLDLSYNELTEVPVSLGGLTTLQGLYLSNNKLTKLPESIGGLVALQLLFLSHNQLTKLPESIGDLMTLQYLYIENNQLTKLPESIGGLAALQILWLSGNKLTKFPESIGGLMTLQYLDLSRNNLTSIPVSLIRLRNLRYFYNDNNPIEYTSPVMVRFIEGLETRRRVGSGTVYNDAQSVHNSSIQKSVYDSLYRILNDKPVDTKVLKNFIVSNEILSEECKRALIEYSDDLSVHSLLGVFFEETLDVVLSIIMRHKDKDEILKIMNQEMSDAMCMCFTGRLTRLLNTLNGFDPRVSITISDSEQIAAIVEIARKKTSDPEEQRELVTRDLRERGYSKEIIEEWSSFIE